MRASAIIAVTLVIALLWQSAGRAEPIAQTEIGALLRYVDKSGCEFYRNGFWYNSTSAYTHLRDKYEYVVLTRSIDSAEDFIEVIATRSSFSGLPYEVRCNGDASVLSNKWLLEELARLRAGRNPSFAPTGYNPILCGLGGRAQAGGGQFFQA